MGGKRRASIATKFMARGHSFNGRTKIEPRGENGKNTCQLLHTAAVAEVSDQSLTKGRGMMGVRECMANAKTTGDEVLPYRQSVSL